MHIDINIEWIELTDAGAVNDPAEFTQALLREIPKPAHIETSGFFDPANPDDANASVQVVLERVEIEGIEQFRLREPIGYWDAHLGGVIVPHDLGQFFTDLTSVPQLMTWLIPRTGKHLPAALIHDGLISKPDEPQTYIAGELISRVDADRIFRDAMKDLETTWVSRWLIWAAVAAASKTKKVVDLEASGVGAGDSPTTTSTFTSTQRLQGWLVVLLTVLTVAALGIVATLEIVDCWNIVPGLANQTTLVELAGGFTAAILIPTFLSSLWGSEWRAGAIAGIAVSLLLHVMAALVVIFGLFKAVDHLSAGRTSRAIMWLGASIAVIGVVTTIVTLVCD